MIKSFTLSALVTFLMATALTNPAMADTGQGKKLHEAHCTKCHDDSVYKRKDKMVHNLNELTQQINSCGHATGTTLNKSQNEALVQYLNATFYHFK